MIVMAGMLSLLGFVFKTVSWLAGDGRPRQTFSLRIHLVERQSLSPICPSTIIFLSYRSLEASLSTSASRSIPGPTVFSLDRNKPVTRQKKYNWFIPVERKYNRTVDRPASTGAKGGFKGAKVRDNS